jgi:hypothetical protein
MWEWTPRVTVRRRRLRLWARAHSAPLPAPRVRREQPVTLAALASGRPLAFRTLFRAPDTAFLAEGTPERDLVELLAAPTLEAAALRANRLAERSWARPGQEAVWGRLRGLALGEVPIAALWGEDRAADALRLRLLRAMAGEPDAELPGMRWGRFLRWAGERLAGTSPLTAVAAASLASARGYRVAFEAMAPRAKPDAASFDVLSLLALRCALEGTFVPMLIEWLVPAGALRRAGVLPRDPWAAALLSLRAWNEQGNVPGLVHLTAALAAADLRERVLTLAGRVSAPVLRQRWWSPPAAGSEEALAGAVAIVRSKAASIAQGERKPWPGGWGGPQLAALQAALEARVGGPPIGLELLLHDRLALAAVCALAGDVAGAKAQLESGPAPSPLRESQQALEQSLARSGAPSLPPFGDWDRYADRLFRQLRGTPDPSVELGSPHWMLEGARGALMTRLVGEGRRRNATAVRTVLERPDLQAELSPFWILRGTGEDTGAVRRLAVEAAGRPDDPPAEGEWIRFIEAVCREYSLQAARGE